MVSLRECLLNCPLLLQYGNHYAAYYVLAMLQTFPYYAPIMLHMLYHSNCTSLLSESEDTSISLTTFIRGHSCAHAELYN